MSSNTISTLVQTRTLAENASKETSDKKLLVAGITLLVISLVGLLIGLGLVMCGLTSGSSFVIAGASLLGFSLLGVGLAIILLGVSHHRFQKLLKQEETLVSSTEIALKEKKKILQEQITKMTIDRDKEKGDWCATLQDYLLDTRNVHFEIDKLIYEGDKLRPVNFFLRTEKQRLEQKKDRHKTKQQNLQQKNQELKQQQEELKQELARQKRILEDVQAAYETKKATLLEKK